jgi:hypothetical protein
VAKSKKKNFNKKGTCSGKSKTKKYKQKNKPASGTGSTILPGGGKSACASCTRD